MFLPFNALLRSIAKDMEKVSREVICRHFYLLLDEITFSGSFRSRQVLSDVSAVYLKNNIFFSYSHRTNIQTRSLM